MVRPSIVDTLAPVVFLDPGQSADEAMFLECYRHCMQRAYQRMHPGYAGRFQVIYPTSDFQHRYGAAQALYGDQGRKHQNIRPRTIFNEDMPMRRYKTVREWVLRVGMARAMSRFEPNSRKFIPKVAPAYRRGMRSFNARATIVLLNPTERDLEFLSGEYEYWRVRGNMPRFVIGAQALDRAGPDIVKWLWGVLCWSDEERKRLREALDGTLVRVRSLSWKGVPGKKTRQKTHMWSFPGGFGHLRRMRKPDLAKYIIDRAKLVGSAWIGGHGDAWRDVERATDCRHYVILTNGEGDAVPYDAMMATSRGAMLIAPNIPVYRGLDVPRKALYPVRAAPQNGASWSPMDLAGWFRSRFGI